MKKDERALLVRILIGGAAGLLAALILYPYLMNTRLVTPVVCLLCAGLGASAGVATLPFADDSRSLLLRSGAHFLVTSVLFLLLVAQYCGWWWQDLLLWEGILALLYALIWLGRWIGWYMEVVQLRTLLGLEPGPSPLKWRETLPYLPFVLLLCDGLPLVLRWLDAPDVPVLSGLILPYLLLPVAGFSSGLSLGKRQGVCPLYPVACFVCYLPMVYLLFNYTALFHCFMVAVPALAGNVLGWMYRRAVPKAQ
ncbi:DUF3021 domain-containing protein [Flintibacter muris]|uniref:DUF3021 domain-containing protein n=1 Tax=Flintibacter muris TaxID=2941327 RepID=UPI00203DC07D|nr:DUF3021 domain-containing protein [Flintibacter muris]